MDHEVTTSERSWLDIVTKADPEREKQLSMGEIVYEFGGGRVFKREPPDPYENHRAMFPDEPVG